MEEIKMTTENPEATIGKKQALLGDLVPLINKKIGRETDWMEKEALAFAVEELYQRSVTVEAFLSGALGVGEEETGRDAAMKIHESVYKAKMRKFDRMIDENPSDAPRLKKIKENIDIGHNLTRQNYRNHSSSIYIGSVLPDWIPSWYGSTNSSPGQES